jgi:serine/threonine protein kinase
MMLDVLDALDAAHRRGIVHCDVKPSNILIGPEWKAWLTDFGIAATDEAPEVRATISGLATHGGFAGSLAYMAPEQARGDRPEPATDLYAFALVAVEALTGRQAIDLRGLTLYRALETLADPELDLAGIPAAWRPVLERALQPEAARRFPSAREMRSAVLAVHADPPVRPNRQTAN